MTKQDLVVARASNEPLDALKVDLFDIYDGAGRNVTYTAESGKVRPYWPNRYLQALKRAIDVGDAEVIAFVTRLVLSDEPSRGFGYLADADRLDLTVEALVADPSKPYHHLFAADTIQAAVDRLAEYGYSTGGQPSASGTDSLASALVRTEDGVAVELVVELTADGDVFLHTDDRTVRADGTLAAVSAFVGLLAQAEAAVEG
jgi:hypothetical protein